MALQIQAQFPDRDLRAPVSALPARALGAAAQIGLDPGQQFPHGEGLGDVVVRPRLQAEDLVPLLLPGGEHDDGHIVALLPQRPADRKAVQFGQHHVQQNRIRVPLPGQTQTFRAVVCL